MKTYEEQVKILAEKLEECEAVVIGAASGMSAAAGHRFYYQNDEVFQEYFGKYEKKYGFQGSFNGYYHNYPSSAHRWAFIAQMWHTIRDLPKSQAYADIHSLLKDKNYYILTTNQDTLFTDFFPEEKISAIQGDFRYLQCSRRCHDKIYPAVELFEKMYEQTDDDLKIPEELIPCCPHCHAQMEPWVRSYVFLEGEKYRDEYRKLNEFLEANLQKKILFLELGVGRMTPMFIQEPFWNLTYNLPQAYYISINPRDALLPRELEGKGLAMLEDITKVLADVRSLAETGKMTGESAEEGQVKVCCQ